MNYVTREGRSDTIAQIGRLDFCPDCESTTHEAVYSHEGRYGEGPIYAVVCTRDWLTGYFTTEVVVVPA